MNKNPPLSKDTPGVRQRQRADGTWRVWWEPNKGARALGFEPLELDENKPTASIRKAEKRNKDVEAARTGKAKRKAPSGGRTVAALIADYRQSLDYKQKRPGTKRGYNTDLNHIEDKWGHAPVAQFDKPVMRTWYETLHANHGASWATSLIRMFSILMTHAEIRGWRPADSNPCFRLKMETLSKRDRSATWAEYDALIAAAGQLDRYAVRAAIALSLFQGQRREDLLIASPHAPEFAWHEVEPGQDPVLVWTQKQSKRGSVVAMPVHDEALGFVTPILNAAKDTDQTHLLIDESTGRPYSGDLFSKRWSAVRDEAAKSCPSVSTLMFRDLRRTFGVWARAGDATKGDVADVLGNAADINPHLSTIYMPSQFYTAARAVASIKRPDTPKRKKA